MVMTDPIADLLTRVRNANSVRHEVVEVPSSKVKKEIANILLQVGKKKHVMKGGTLNGYDRSNSRFINSCEKC